MNLFFPIRLEAALVSLARTSPRSKRGLIALRLSTRKQRSDRHRPALLIQLRPGLQLRRRSAKDKIDPGFGSLRTIPDDHHGRGLRRHPCFEKFATPTPTDDYNESKPASGARRPFHRARPESRLPRPRNRC